MVSWLQKLGQQLYTSNKKNYYQFEIKIPHCVIKFVFHSQRSKSGEKKTVIQILHSIIGYYQQSVRFNSKLLLFVTRKYNILYLLTEKKWTLHFLTAKYDLLEWQSSVVKRRCFCELGPLHWNERENRRPGLTQSVCVYYSLGCLFDCFSDDEGKLHMDICHAFCLSNWILCSVCSECSATADRCTGIYRFPVRNLTDSVCSLRWCAVTYYYCDVCVT
jgi:hypothetical protein